jgi:anti-sigma factor RsiW
MNCENFRGLLARYVDDDLAEEDRKRFRRHLQECSSCREAALEVEPSLLFVALPARAPAAGQVEACAAAVTARIRQDRLQNRLNRRRLPWLAAAAATIVAVSGGLAWRVMTGGGEAILQPSADTLRKVEEQTIPPTVEVETDGDEVRVYRFTTDDDANTAVYFIVDPALEL